MYWRNRNLSVVMVVDFELEVEPERVVPVVALVPVEEMDFR